MGNKPDHAIKKNTANELTLTRNSWEFLYVIGKGGFGKVWKVVYKKNKKFYALKEMSKAKIVEKKSQNSVKYERELLSKIRHPFIVNMIFCFQDRENLYLVMDLLTGGDLRYHVSRNKRFSEEQTKFFVACILLALDYLHINNILHRDIKPENLVLDEKGYVRLTDFGIAKLFQKENSSETSGTPGYMAPEVMCAQNHTIAVDYFALGVMTYEFMMGKRPYLGKTRKEIKEHIMSKQVQVTKNDIVEGWTLEAGDFINKLLQRKPANRLGLRGAQEVKDHVWFKNYPWKDLYEKKINPLFLPKVGDNFDQKYCQALDKIGQNTKENNENMIRRDTIQEFFKKFTFISNEDEINNKESTAKKDDKTVKKFTNPHSNLSSSVESTRVTKQNHNDKGFPSIDSKLNNSKASTTNLNSHAPKANLVFKVLKKSSSAINYNYIKNKPKTGISSYYFQN